MKPFITILCVGFIGCGISITSGSSGKPPAISDVPTSDAIVKMESFPCSSEGKSFQTTGLLVAHREKVYVITSEAFVYHGNGPYCHEIHVSDLRAKIDFLAADWGRGLAVFSAPSLTPKNGMITMAGLNLSPSDGARVSVQGFPLKKNELRVDDSGHVLLASSGRHGIALIDRVSEIQGAYVDSAMAGGAVFHAWGGLMGMISHQYLKMTLGNRTRPFDWDGKAGHWERHWILIPSATIKEFFENAIQTSGHPPAFHRLPQDQMQEKVRVLSEGLSFQIECPSEGASDVGEGPIGGADGVGVGGDGTTPYCKLQLAQASDTVGIWPFDWRKKWKDSLLHETSLGHKSETLFFIHRDTDDGRLSRETFRSMGEFFQRMKDRSLLPVTLVYGKPTSVGTTEALVKEKAKELSAIAKPIYDFIPKVEKGMEFMRGIYFVLRVLESEQWDSLKKQEIEILSDRNGKYRADWVTMMRLTPEPAEKLWQTLQSLKELLP